MQQSTAYETRPAPGSKALALLRYLPYISFFLWMVYKQHVGLLASGIAPGPDMLLATVGILLVVSPWVYWAEGRRRLVAMTLLNTGITFILFADIIYFRQFGDLVSVASLRFASQLSTVKDSVVALLRPSDLLLWVDIPLIAALLLVPRQAAERWWGRFQSTRLNARQVGYMAAIGVLIVAGVALVDPMLKAKYYGHSMVASRMGLINYHVFDVGNYVGRLAARAIPSAPAVQEVSSWMAMRRPADPAGAPLYGVAKGKNVIVIQWESLQAFAMDLKFGGQEVTPNLNRLARQSLNWTDFYHQTGQGVTSDADLLGNCSLFPTRTGAVYYDYAHNDYRCMPELLREEGYKAVAMQGMPPDFWNLASVYPNVGFERYYNLKDGLVVDEKVGIGLSDESYFRQVIPHLKSLQQPYYSFLVTLTSHGPFDFEGIPHELDLGALEGTQLGHYLHAVRYTDRALGQFLDALEREGMLDNAVVMLYGDHAGVFRTSSGIDQLGISPDDEPALTRMEKRVPFMVRLPGAAHAGDQPHAAGQVDIAPTLAGLLGVDVTDEYLMGRNLLLEPAGVVPFYTGSALNDDLLFWSKDINPALGRCFQRSTGQEVAINTCVPLAEEAARALKASRHVVTRNLIPQLKAQQ